MPYYRITLRIKSRRTPFQGIRQLEVWNPDTAYRMVRQQVLTRFRESEIILLDVVMVPKSSEEVKVFLRNGGVGKAS